MLRTALTTTAFSAALTVGALTGSAGAATVLDDPLHGQCFSGTTLCSEFQNSITTIIGPPGFTGSNYGFTISPGKGFPGTFDILFAVPNNAVPGSSIVTTGTINGTSIGSVTASSLASWSSSQTTIEDVSQVAAAFPGASPTNTFSNAISFTQVSDPTATGYQLFEAQFGSQILQDNSVANSVATLKAAIDLSTTNLPVGTIIFGFFDDTDPNNTGWVAAANSGTLWVDATDAPPVPEPASIALLGVGLLGLGMVTVRRRNG